jgi:enolase-phosphatase E1
VILLDIEGTTTPIAFVTDTLFPYARTHLPLYLERQAGTPECRRAVSRLRAEYDADRAAGEALPDWSPRAYLDWLMDRDRKSPALKELQGRVWEEGYRNGTLVGEVFADVPGALAHWRGAGVPVGIYSSGSVRAQQWLFRRSTAGDLTPLLSWHFDTGIGGKRDAASYARIAEDVNMAPWDILFVSDVTAELDAARDAGMKTALIVRPGNPPQPDTGHRTIGTLLVDAQRPGNSRR